MDNQIFEFEGEREAEWQVDHILSHKGAKEDAICEVRWTAGDITWFTYEQVAHLEALGKYLYLLGHANIAELLAGHGTPTRDDPCIDVGFVSQSILSEYYIKYVTVFIKP
jgi:hypothetical protein